jgi:carbamoyl-phosphate synthase large subunit
VIELSADEFPDPDSEAGRALVDGFAEFFDVGEFDDLRSAIRSGEVDIIVSRNREALEVAVEEDVTYFSTHASARATLAGLRHHDDPIDVQATSDRPRRTRDWGGE